MEVFAVAYRDNLTINHQAIRDDRLSARQQALLLHRINVPLGRFRRCHDEM
jgi:hypothetical protein